MKFNDMVKSRRYGLKKSDSIVSVYACWNGNPEYRENYEFLDQYTIHGYSKEEAEQIALDRAKEKYPGAIDYWVN